MMEIHMKKITKRILLGCLLAFAGCPQGQAQIREHNGRPETAEQKAERMRWWTEARFGMFIHWGVYAQFGGQYRGYEQARGGAEWIMNRCKIPVAEYQKMAKEFNPSGYDPDQWVKMAKDAGMKYIVITAKHHDGFALFETKTSPWNVVEATPYGKDLIKPLAEACRKYGLKLGFYYSQAQDWNNPGGSAARKPMREGWPNPDSTAIDAYTLAHKGHWDPAQETATFEQYINNVSVPQVKELLSNYGDIAVLWWDTPTNMTDEDAQKLHDLLKLQPQIITNDRLKRPNFKGDTSTPEQKVPDWSELDGQYWETCMTMNGSWGYRYADHNWKSSETLIRNLIDIASKGGNYLLNIGPKPDGTFPEASIERLADIGSWMEHYGEAIYETKASPLEPFSWGRCTMKSSGANTTLYIAVFDWPADGVARIALPQTREVLSVGLLGTESVLPYTITDGDLLIQLPALAPDSFASVIKLEVEGSLVNMQKKSPTKEMQSGALDELP